MFAPFTTSTREFERSFFPFTCQRIKVSRHCVYLSRSEIFKREVVAHGEPRIMGDIVYGSIWPFRTEMIPHVVGVKITHPLAIVRDAGLERLGISGLQAE